MTNDLGRLIQPSFIMRHTMFLLLLTPFVLGLSGPCVAHSIQTDKAVQANTVQADKAAQIDALVQRFMDEEKVPGMAVAVMQAGKILHARGYGYSDLENAVKATEHTVFRIASNTKRFTTVALLLLQKQGKLRLEDDISKYFPEFAATGRKVTIEQLLNHLSGLSLPLYEEPLLDVDADVDALRDLSPETLSKLFAQAKFEFAPGERFRYNNNAFQLAGLLVERVSGQSFAAFLKQHIFDPLEMNESYFLDNYRIIEHRASGYTIRDGAILNAEPYLIRGFGAGALGSTVLDLMKWQSALLQNRLLDAADLKRMTTPARLADGTLAPYGLGYFLGSLDGKRRNGHYGSASGFRSQLAHYPDADLSIAVLANMNPARTEVLESRIVRAMLDIPEVVVTEISVSAEQLQSYAGNYAVTDAPVSRRSGVHKIEFQDGALYADRFRLRPIAADVFVPVGDPYHRYTFIMSNAVPVGLRVEREGELMVDALRQATGELVELKRHEAGHAAK